MAKNSTHISDNPMANENERRKTTTTPHSHHYGGSL
jgi:hypothetical protein